jgi:hypothetical protein
MFTGDELTLYTINYRILLPNNTYFILGRLLNREKLHSLYYDYFLFDHMPDEYPEMMEECHNKQIFEEITPTCCCMSDYDMDIWGPVENYTVSWVSK